MMQIMLKLELEDIVTRPFGCNIGITPPKTAGKLWIILSPEAAQELVADIQTILPTLPQPTEEAPE